MSFGGAKTDQIYSVQQTLDGGYILGGSTQSYAVGGTDAWLIKVSNDTDTSAPTPVLTTILTSPTSVTLNTTETQNFTATALDQNNTPMPGINISWTVSNSTVGNVTPLFAVTGPDGNVSAKFTALAVGTTNVTATNGTVSGWQTVTVTEPTSTPILTVSPQSGQQETIFQYSGSSYTPNGAIDWHVLKPDGTEYPVGSLTADSSGNLSYQYSSSCNSMVGSYTIWAIDITTGKKSNNVTQTISAAPSCIVSSSITVIFPNGGENWQAGSTQTIQWSYTGNPGSDMKIELLKGGVTVNTIIASTPLGSSGSGSYSWNIPSTQAPETDYRIRITSTTNSAYTDTSDSDFSISALTTADFKLPLPGGKSWLLTVEAKDGKTLWGTIDKYHVNRNALDFDDSTKEDGQLINVPVLAAADGKVIEAGGTSKITCTGKDANGYYVKIAHSNGLVSVYLHFANPPLVKKGDSVIQGQQIGIVGNTGCSFGSHIHFEIQPSDATNFLIEGISIDNYKIGTTKQKLYYVSTNTIIYPPTPTITVTSPNGGENWQAGSTQTIQWSYIGNPGSDIKIELLKGGVVNKVIVSRYSIGSGGAGTYDWKIPSNQILGTDYNIRITSTTNSAYIDTSDGNFAIVAPETRAKGLDVSNYQHCIGSICKPIDWDKVYKAGKIFAWVKADQGIKDTLNQPRFKEDMDNGIKAGLKMGAYHFSQPTKYGAVDEANHFIKVAGKYFKNGNLTPVLDVEDIVIRDPKTKKIIYSEFACQANANANKIKQGLSKADLTKWVNDFVSTVKQQTGVTPIIYTSASYGVSCLDANDKNLQSYKLWISQYPYRVNPDKDNPAHYPKKSELYSGIWKQWDFWQYTDGVITPTHTDGIPGKDPDLDVLNGDESVLINYIIKDSKIQ